MSQLVFFLEEPSAQAMLEGVLPRVLPLGTAVRYVVFEGKQDLDKQLERRLRGYRVPDAQFVVLRDQDSADCRMLKSQLRQKCDAAGKPAVLIRIACRELESWYLADLWAVGTGLGIRGIAELQKRAKYRVPDTLANAAKELENVTKNAYQKIAGSRAIGPLLDLGNSRSHSFAVFVTGLRRLIASVSGETQ